MGLIQSIRYWIFRERVLPLRFRILEYVNSVEKANVDLVLDVLGPEYGTEKQFTRITVDHHLRSLRANGLIEEVDYRLHGADDVLIDYVIHEDGKKILEGLPKWWTNRDLSGVVE
jgi:DNA-binding transcriptional ArsR family regulator